MARFQVSGKSQSEAIRILLAAGWTEDESRDYRKNGTTNLYLWRWRQPKTGALFTLHDALDFLKVAHGTRVTTKKR